MKRIEDSLRDLWDNIKRTNIRIIRVPEEEEKKKGSEKIFEEIIVENFLNMGKEIVTQVQEVQRVPYRINTRRNMPRHILIKLSKIKYSGWSQDDRLGGYRVRISTQLGHLPGTGGGPRTSKGMGGMPATGCFNYIFIFHSICFIVLILFCFLFLVIVHLLFILFFYCATWFMGSWFPGQGSGLSSCGGRAESKPLN